MQFTIKEYSIYNEGEILNLYDSVGWSNYTSNPSMLKNAYKHSLKILGAYDADKLVGIIRVVGDGYSIVYIQDIIVLPEYQRKGILFIAAAIGNDKQNIERIYGDSFLDISDLNQLPTKLTNVVKRHVRV